MIEFAIYLTSGGCIKLSADKYRVEHNTYRFIQMIDDVETQIASFRSRDMIGLARVSNLSNGFCYSVSPVSVAHDPIAT